MLPYLYMCAFIVSFAYVVLQIFNAWAWHTAMPRSKHHPKSNQSQLSVVIPFRNESLRISPILQSLKKVETPIEVLFVDDHSTDKSRPLIEAAGHTVVLNEGNGKKDALNTGIHRATSSYILSVDADCFFHQGYIEHKISQTTSNADMITGLVSVTTDKKTILSSTQQYLSNAFQSLQAFGEYSNSPFVASGANLLFKKSAFLDVNGYEGNRDISSGDDTFLLQKFKERQKTIIVDYSKEGLVHTPAEASWRNYISQQSRWASKNNQSKSLIQYVLYFFTALFHLCFITSWIWSMEAFVLLMIVKGLSELSVINAVQTHFKQGIPWLHYPFIWLISPFILIYAQYSKYWQTLHWKDRKITY